MDSPMNRFIVVTGLPASGKSTVGVAVARSLGLPLLDKDEILEALFEALGVGDSLWRSRLSRAADEVLQRQALHSPGAVIVSWWRHPLSPVASGASPDWLRSLSGLLFELHCRCRPQVAIERFFARERHVGHLDSSRSRAEELPKLEHISACGPLGIGRVIEIDTEQQLDLPALLAALEVPESG